MATRKGAAKGRDSAQPGGKVDLSTHPLVAERKVDPSEIEPAAPELSVLFGYIGPSSREGTIRLYQDLTFRNYYEIPSAAVVSTAPVNPDDENSPTRVEVAPDTNVEVVTVSVQSVEARYLSGSIAGGFYAAGAGAATTGQPLCTNITTYMPSCVGAQPAGGPQCFIVMTTQQCTFGGAGAATPDAPCAVGFTTRTCTYATTDYSPCGNITTHVPSCVQCNPNCIATVVTSGVPGGGGICITLHTANPSNCAPHCDPNCVATVVTSHGGPQPQAFAAAAAPAPGVAITPAPFCITLHTANPSNCPVFCITIGPPTRVHPCLITHGIATVCRPPCGIVPTRFPTFCAPQPCGFVPTRFPSCDVQVTATITAGPGPLGAAAPPVQCITLHTAVPTWCEPCQPIANTAATLCTQHITGPNPATAVCPTIYTATPTGCG